MTFSFYAPPSLSPEQAGGIPSLIGSILNGATEAKKARYQQMLQEAQAKQAMAQAGYYGEETKGKKIENQFLPQTRQTALDVAQLELQKLRALQAYRDQKFGGNPNAMPNGGQSSFQLPPSPSQGAPNLSQYISRASGQTSSPDEQKFALSPEQIQRLAKAMPPPKMKGSQLSAQPDNFNQQDQMPQFDQSSQPPEMTHDDYMNKEALGIDTYKPKADAYWAEKKADHKAYVDAVTKNMTRKKAEEYKTESKKHFEDLKTTGQAQLDLPKLHSALNAVDHMIDIATRKPAFFGHYFAPGWFAAHSSDPESGKFTTLSLSQLATLEHELSEKGNQLALKATKEKLPTFAETQQSALGKLTGIKQMLQDRLDASIDLAGGDVIRRGTKRFIEKDGVWGELK